MAKPTQLVVFKGQKCKLIVLCKERDKDPMLVRQRLRQGWNLKRALEQESKFGPEFGTWGQYERFLARNRVRKKASQGRSAFNELH